MKFIAPLTGLILVLPAVLAAPPSDSDGDAGDSSTGGKYRETAHMTWRGEVVEGLEQFTKEAHSYAQGVADQVCSTSKCRHMIRHLTLFFSCVLSCCLQSLNVGFESHLAVSLQWLINRRFPASCT